MNDDDSTAPVPGAEDDDVRRNRFVPNAHAARTGAGTTAAAARAGTVDRRDDGYDEPRGDGYDGRDDHEDDAYDDDYEDDDRAVVAYGPDDGYAYARLDRYRDAVRAPLERTTRMVRDNPTSAVLIGTGLALLVLGDRRGRIIEGVSRSAPARVAREAVSEAGEAAADARYRAARTARRAKRRAERLGTRASEAIDEATSTVVEGAERVGRTVSERTEEVTDTVTGAVRDGAATARAAVRGVARDAGRSADRGVDAVRRRGERASEVADRVGTRSGRVARRVRDRAESVAERPALVGALALAAGGGLAALLPRTRAETEWLGRHRDDLIGEAGARAGEVVRDTVGAAREQTAEAVTAAARDAAEQAAAQALENTDAVADGLLDVLGVDERKRRRPGAKKARGTGGSKAS